MNIKNRNKIILELYYKGKTYHKIGDKYGVSRERIRQIINKELGHRPDRMQERRERKSETLKNWEKEVKFICAQCGKVVTNGEAGGRRTFCCDKCSTRARNTRRKGKSKCAYCGCTYSPFRVRKYKDLDLGFCCFKHYNLWRKDNKGKGIFRTKCRERNIKILKMKEAGMKYEEVVKVVGKMSRPAFWGAIYNARKYK